MIILLLVALACIVVILLFTLSFAAETLDAEMRVSQLRQENTFLRLQLEEKIDNQQKHSTNLVVLKENENKEWFI